MKCVTNESIQQFKKEGKEFCDRIVSSIIKVKETELSKQANTENKEALENWYIDQLDEIGILEDFFETADAPTCAWCDDIYTHTESQLCETIANFIDWESLQLVNNKLVWDCTYEGTSKQEELEFSRFIYKVFPIKYNDDLER